MIVRPETRQQDNLFIDVLTKHKACAEIKTNHTEVYYELWLQKSDDTFRLTVSQPKLPSLYMYGKVKMLHHMMKLQYDKVSKVPSKCMQNSCLLHMIHSKPHFDHSAVTLAHTNQRARIKIGQA